LGVLTRIYKQKRLINDATTDFYMITIIGAGPVGCHTAQLLAKNGNHVQVIEEHKEIGKPVQCTGIVTKSLSETIPFKNEWVVNRLKKVIVHAPNGKTAEIKIDDIVIDRTGFDNYLAERAKKEGAKIMLNSRMEKIEKKEANKKLKIVTEGKEKTILTEKLIGADGPNSIVSRFMGNKKPDCWIGLQAVVKMDVDKDAYSVYFGDDMPGFFGWVVPENENTSRIGIASTQNPKKVFDKFMKRFSNYKILQMQGGLIPKYDSHITLQKDDSFIVGDAATQVKATTGGGLVPGLKATECLARAIKKGTNYSAELTAVNKELKTNLVIRNILDRFTENDYDRLIELISKDKMRELLNKHDRDKPSSLLFKALITEPRLLFFAKTLIRAKRL
jgi:digeranylgeranylglycerophospholipid reductase